MGVRKKGKTSANRVNPKIQIRELPNASSGTLYQISGQMAQMRDLPHEIAVDILLRLPVKSLLRFRCVCRSWYALICSPQFVALHYKRATQKLIVATECSRNISLYSVDYDGVDNENAIQELDFSTDDPNLLKYAAILGSCNGLLLVGVYQDSFLYLWNPSTREYKELPDCPDSEYDYRVYGLGYHSRFDDYKVVVINPVVNEVGFPQSSHVIIYSLKTHSWKCVGEFPCRILHYGTSINIHGVPHWLMNCEDHREEDSDSNLPALGISYFDFENELFEEVPGPDCEWPNNNPTLDLAVFGGCLCLTFIRGENREIWIMKEYGIKESWVKLFNIMGLIAYQPFHRLNFLALMKCGDLLVQIVGKKLVVYSPNKNVYKEMVISREKKKLESAMLYVESLVPLRGEAYSRWQM